MDLSLSGVKLYILKLEILIIFNLHVIRNAQTLQSLYYE